MNALFAVISILYFICSGFGAFSLITTKREKIFSCWGIIPIAFALGYGLLAVLVNIFFLFGVKLSFFAIYAAFLPLFFIGLYNIHIDFPNFLLSSRKIGPFGALLVFIIVFIAISVLLMSIVFPVHFWDSRAIWALKGKMLFHDATVHSPNFTDINRVHPHFGYPLLFPMAQASIYFAISNIDDWAIMPLIGLFFPLILSLFYDIQRILFIDRSKALFGTAVLSVTPLFFMIDGPVHSGYADTPLALFFLAGFVVLLVQKITGRLDLLVLGSVLAGFLPLVKNEGISLLFINLFLMLLPSFDENIKYSMADSLKRFFIVLAICFIIIAPWSHIASNLPKDDEQYLSHFKINEVIRNLNKIPEISKFMVNAFVGIQPDIMGRYFEWGILWIVFVLAGLNAYYLKNRLGISLFLIIILFCLFMGFIYVIAPGKPQDMIANFFRVMLPMTPILVLLLNSQSESIFALLKHKKDSKI